MQTIKSFMSPAIILEALNDGKRWAKEREANATWWATKAHRQRPMPAQPQIYVQAGLRLRDKLRGYIDAWISTGVASDGSETPANRDLSQVPGAVSMVSSYLRENAMIEVSDAGKTALMVIFGARWTDKNKPQGGDPMLDAEAEAERLFALTMASDFRLTISRCRGCGRYYQISNPEVTYTHGTYHGKCLSKTNALRITRERRAWSDEQLLEAAAKFAKEHHNHSSVWQQKNKMTVWIAEKLTKDVCKNPVNTHHLHGVKRNWVTRHWPEIEARIH